VARDTEGCPPVRPGVFHANTTFERHVKGSSALSGKFEVAPPALPTSSSGGGTVRHRLAGWRHAKGIGDELTVHTDVSDDWRILGARLLEAERSLPPRGPTRSAAPLTLVERDGIVNVAGVADADVTVEPLMSPR
jgi:hypothetical protein